MRKTLALISLLLVAAVSTARIRRHVIPANEMISLIAHYRDSVAARQAAADSVLLHSSFTINVDRRNPTLMLIPSMYAIARGKNRKFVAEAVSMLYMKGGRVTKADVRMSRGNVPQNRDVMTILRQLAVPDIYAETIFGNYLLSPLSRYNAKAYRYYVTSMSGGRVEIVFLPRVRNAQLVSGKATVERFTGRVMSAEFSGILDMIDFSLRLRIGRDMKPLDSRARIKFSFAGNRVSSTHHLRYNPTDIPADTAKAAADSVGKPRPTLIGRLGDYFIERLRGSFGTRQQGSYRLSPLVNPLYLSYSSRSGVTYRLKLQAGYRFSEQTCLSLSARAAYSFKQKQLYFSVPLNLDIGKRIRIETQFSSGNHITSSEILDRIKNEKADSIQWDKLNLQYFRSAQWGIHLRYRLSDRWSARVGTMFHRRTAIDKAAFYLTGTQSSYHSFAPDLQLQYQPWGEKGPMFTIDYERGIKGILHSHTAYERFETDASWKTYMHRMRILSARLGYGLYTSRSHGAYFLDYNNFHYENIPEGWDDDWTGEFQLLNSNWYNASRYYLRSNLTYESPLMLLSWLPIVGRHIETERVYANWLFTDKLHPYIEIGYGMTNKVFSTGIFFSVSNKRIGGFGARFALELFRDW